MDRRALKPWIGLVEGGMTKDVAEPFRSLPLSIFDAEVRDLVSPFTFRSLEPTGL